MKKIILLPLLLIMLSCSSQSEDLAKEEHKAMEVVNQASANTSKAVEEDNESWLAKTIEKDGYFFIPEDALQDSVKAILCPSYLPDKKVDNRKVFDFYWHPGAMEGSYHITITPEQIYLSSSGGDKNPSYLYWVQKITQAQYEKITESLRNSVPAGFSDVSQYYPERYVFFDESSFGRLPVYREPTVAEWNEVTQNYDSLLMAQIRKVFNILNANITDKGSRLETPTKEKMDKFSPKLFGFSKAELQNWVRILKK